LSASTAPKPKRARTGYLATPLSQEEQRSIAQMYRQHQGILRLMGRKMLKKYHYVASDDLFSCCDIAFIKTCRAWDPKKGTFSTLLTVFCEGEILHWIRDNNWLVKAPGNVRFIGQRARRLIEADTPTEEILSRLQITDAQLKLALVATQPTDHDIRGFDLHICPRPTPWDALEGEESW
jgi:DNA-directed RNA polymerase specialized sigma subunit